MEHNPSDLMRERLHEIGVQVTVQRFTGDSSYPEEHTLKYGPVQAVGPTLDLALIAFVEKLLMQVELCPLKPK